MCGAQRRDSGDYRWDKKEQDNQGRLVESKAGLPRITSRSPMSLLPVPPLPYCLS